MINLLLGPPGAGKSYEAVVFHILAAVQRGRKVITNLPVNLEAFGAIDSAFPALLEVREQTLAAKPADVARDTLMAITSAEREARARWSDRAFANPEDFASDWRHPDGWGPLYVVDECHFCMPVGRTQVAVEEWFSMHRHYNADVLLITQSSNKISRAIRDLVQVCYKVRKAVALGKPDGYIRKVLDGVGGGEMSVTQRSYQPQYFGLWKSHTQGVAVAEQKADDVAPFLVKFNRFRNVFLVVACAFAAWAFWPSTKAVAVAKDKPVGGEMGERVKRATEAYNAEKARQAPEPSTPAENAAQAPASEPQDPNAVPEPYEKKALHVTGVLAMGKRTLYTFSISDGGKRISDATSDDLIKAGYRWEPLTDCAGTLRWKKTARAVTCDAPAIPQGSKMDPVLLAVPTVPHKPSAPGAM